MTAHMTKLILLIGAPNHPWRKTLQLAVKPFGELDVYDEAQSYLKRYKKKYDLVIIDATEIKYAEEWVARLRGQLPTTRVVVMADAPTWQQAREAFLAGAMDYAKKLGDKDKLSKFLSDLLDTPMV
jgi:DNA-binding NtrC family response regulator